MKASELRIGNLVGLNLAEFKENFFRMIEIADHACVVTDRIRDNTTNVDREYFECEELEAIPLTAEWLERFGFEKYEDTEGEKLTRHGKILLNKRFALRYSDTNDDWYYSTAIVVQHVHQLQNLYFALTGTELTLTP